MGIRGRRPEPGKPGYGRRMLNIKDVSLWDWAIARAAERRMSLSQYIENLIKNQKDKEDQQW